MSALAARRAAAAARVTSLASAGPVSAPSSASPPLQSLVSGTARSPPSPTPSSPSEHIDIHFSESEPEAGPSKRPRRTSGSKPRYFGSAGPTSADASDVTQPRNSESRQRQRRRFSPSAPASGGEDDDSSESEDTVKAQESDTTLQTYEGRDGRRRPDIPPGKAETIGAAVNGVDGDYVGFQAREGVNWLRLDEDALRPLGMEGRGPGVLIALRQDEASRYAGLMLAGTFLVAPLWSIISLNSVDLTPTSQPTSYPVFAPTSHPLPAIRTGHPVRPLRRPPSHMGFKLSLPSSFDVSSDDRPIALLLIQEHLTGVEGMRAGAMPGFGHAWMEEKGAWGLRGVHPVVGSFPYPVYPYLTPRSWSSALADLDPPQAQTNNHTFEQVDVEPETPSSTAIRLLIKGAKRSGKSTFARAALNRLLRTHEKVAWLECDLGQGEFSPGGVVGLWLLDKPVYGPPFSHPRVPHRAHFVGSFTTATCPDDYLAAIQGLVQYYRYEVQYPMDTLVIPRSALVNGNVVGSEGKVHDLVPLVVNTPGWVKGLGEELLQAIDAVVEPTHVFAFEAPVTEDELEAPWARSPPPHPFQVNAYGPSVKQYILAPTPSSPLQARNTAAELRALSMLSYFYAQVPGSGTQDDARWDFSLPLLATQPYEVAIGEAIREVYLVGEGSEGVLAEDLPLALNGAVVALLSPLADLDPDPTRHAYLQGRPAPAVEDTTFLGLAFVRAVHAPSPSQLMKLQVLTPLPPHVLEKASVLVKNGAMEMPTAGMLDWQERWGGGHGGGGFGGESPEERPFFESGEAVIGGSRRRVRRNLQRKGI